MFENYLLSKQLMMLAACTLVALSEGANQSSDLTSAKSASPEAAEANGRLYVIYSASRAGDLTNPNIVVSEIPID